jgi:predicted amidohydrolase YtcJ
MRRTTNLLIVSFLMILSSCYKGKAVDLIVHNAKIHIMDDAEHLAEAMAIKDGKIVEVGPERQILNRYAANEEIDAQGREIYPGFTDCQGHLLSYAQQKLSVDLTDCMTMDEVLFRIEKHHSKHDSKFIVGRGWDECLLMNDSLPDNKKLSLLFPNIPVCLIHADGHALLANSTCLKLANITPDTKIQGGLVVLNAHSTCSGLLTDKAMEPVLAKIPNYSEKDVISALKDIEIELFQYGITGVHEAGIEFRDISLFRKLIDSYNFRLNVNAMLTPTRENIAFARTCGVYNYKNLLIRSFKVIADGSLNSRGALLKQAYTDEPNHLGMPMTPLTELKRIAKICEETGYQMNTQANGDSANALVLNLYSRIFEVNKDHRWRIEQTQMIDINDFNLFSKYGVFPCVQPLQASKDQKWISERIGRKRMNGTHAFHTLLNKYGMLAIGSSFPANSVDPFATIYAAINRKNANPVEVSRFEPNERITLSDCLKGMTIWAAFSSFQENDIGTLEKGKDATFTMLEKPIEESNSYKPNFSLLTVIRGKKVYSSL